MAEQAIRIEEGAQDDVNKLYCLPPPPSAPPPRPSHLPFWGISHLPPNPNFYYSPVQPPSLPLDGDLHRGDLGHRRERADRGFKPRGMLQGLDLVELFKYQQAQEKAWAPLRLGLHSQPAGVKVEFGG